MQDNIESTIRDLLVCLQTAKLYETEHPIFKKSADKAYLSLQDILRLRHEVAIGIVGEELIFEKEIFFEMSKLVRPAILYLKARGIEKIVFSPGLSKEELIRFIAFLVAPKEEITGDPQQNLFLSGVRNISVGKMQVSAGAQPEKEPISPLGLYETSTDKVSQSIASVLNFEAFDHLALKFSINNLIENLSFQYQGLLKLTSVKRHDLETFTHLLNVSILSMFFSSKLGFARNDVLDIGISALFHDIGKLYISSRVIAKTEKLTEEEFSQIESHTVLGAELLLRYVDSLGVLPVVVSFEHHLKYDLTGYPKLKFVQNQHIASSIVAICDVYDALSERRKYKLDYPPDLIYKLMINEKSKAFNPELIDKFFKIIGVWPIGSIVALNDSRIAVVVDENEDDIFSPKIEVISPTDKKEMVDLKEEKARYKIERFLNPWREGKEFLDLLRGS